MDSAHLPLQSAQEPDEEARQPQVQCLVVMPPPNMKPQKSVTPEATQSTVISQSNTDDVLSQPQPGLSQRQRLLWLQQRRSTGLWVRCDECDRWRFLPHVLDRHELPILWYCRMNPDSEMASCSAPEPPFRVRDEEDLIHSEYSAGSLVLARLTGWPWWPAMVDDCPEAEQFYWLDMYSDIPTYYNVVFFDSNDQDVQRAWVRPENIKPFGSNKNKKDFQRLLKDSVFSDRLMAAVKQAKDAESLPLSKRLTKYGFVSRYRGQIKKPGKIKPKVLKKFQNNLKRKFNIVFECDSDDSDFEANKKSNATAKRSATKKLVPSSNNKSNRIILGKGAFGNATIVETNIENGSAGEALKQQPNSLAVQVGSAVSTARVSESFDDDTSKTYVPEDVSESESVTFA